jgi:hypothetical protein
MHTAETETHASGPLAFLQKRRFMQSEDTAIATLAAWTIGLLIFTLAGFYIGSIAGHDNHPEGRHRDLDVVQLTNALPFAAAGLAIGLIFALWITFGYTPSKLRELEHEQGGH